MGGVYDPAHFTFQGNAFMSKATAAILLLSAIALPIPPAIGEVLSGAAAFGDVSKDAPGVTRHIGPSDLPAPHATEAKAFMSTVASPPKGAAPQVPPGFTVTPFAHLAAPRQIRVAPNGDIFVAETKNGKVTVLRAADGATEPSQTATFASGLGGPFGIAFYPLGPDPQYVYVANAGSVVRYPYRSGDLTARGPAETIVPEIPSIGYHATRDIAFSADGKRLFISVGSGSNTAETMDKANDANIKAAERARGLGAGWGPEALRADVLVTSPDGKAGLKSFANGIRNCVTLTVQPKTGDLWCTNNERDMMGDDLPPDYVTPVKEGAFYGWPWFYTGNHEDPTLKGQRPDLAGKVTTPAVLIQPHSAPLGMAFYTGGAFPKAYQGDAFVALHGSWNRANRTGYKVVRILLKDGVPTGEDQDFLTGLVTGAGNVWGRPVAVAVAHDGSLIVGEDGNGTLWRISYTGGTP
jgi:glucose/arabinose dehydrogenase